MKKFLKSTIYRHFFKPLFWRIFSKYRNNFDIFCFHREVPKEKFDQLTYEEKEFAVTTDFFDSFLSFASSRYKFCSLDYGISNLKTNNLLCHITFDDGYKDNLDYALPILKKFNVPATIYIADGIIDRKHLLLNHMCTSKIDEFLTWSDVKKLDADELIEIGGHTS